MDTMIDKLQSYAKHLQDVVMERTEQLEIEKNRADTLLNSLLPR